MSNADYGGLEGYDSSYAASLRSTFDKAKGGNLNYDTSGEGFYDPKTVEYYQDRFEDANSTTTASEYRVYNPEAPAKLTDLPTSSTNSQRPRTVAAGYDASRGVMTVVFRDGTVYNYYKVSPEEWIDFQTSISKGRPWLNKFGPGTPGIFIGKPHGPADMSAANPDDLSDIYRVVRDAQVRFATKRAYRVQTSTGVKLQTRVTKSAQTKSKLSKASLGTNPTKLGKNPRA